MNIRIFAVLAVNASGKRETLAIGGQDAAVKCTELCAEVIAKCGKVGDAQYARVLLFKDGRITRDKRFSVAPVKVEVPKAETPKVETPKVETPKVEAPKAEIKKGK